MSKSPREMQEIRGRRSPRSSRTPWPPWILSSPSTTRWPSRHTTIRRCGDQKLVHRVKELLAAVRIPSPEARMKEFPHQMSGGMRQRIVGAVAQAGGPQIIIADEPTTNLDVTIQLQYLNLLKDLQRPSGCRPHLRHAQPGYRRQDVRQGSGDVCR